MFNIGTATRKQGGNFQIFVFILLHHIINGKGLAG
jgi:hypothetical protein